MIDGQHFFSVFLSGKEIEFAHPLYNMYTYDVTATHILVLALAFFCGFFEIALRDKLVASNPGWYSHKIPEENTDVNMVMQN